MAQAAADLYVFFANASKAFAMLASRFLYESDMMWLNNKWLMIDDRNFLKMRHGDDSVMEVSRTPSGARDAVHRIYLGRTAMAKYNWKTPYELVTDQKPNLSHLKVYGCKAYALKHHIPRKQKLEPRAHIGYLVGYDSINIFRIWIPSRRKIIRSRDVLFDEDEVHSLVDPPDLLHFLSTTGDNAPYIITDRMRNALAELDGEDEKHRSTFDELFANSPTITEKPVITEKPGIGLGGPSRKRPHDTAPNILPTPTPSLSPSPSILGGDSDDATGLPPIMRCARAMRPLRSRNIAPQAQTIPADLDDDHILPEGSQRQRTTRHNVYATQLEEVGQGSTDPFHASFAALTICSSSFSIYDQDSFILGATSYSSTS